MPFIRTETGTIIAMSNGYLHRKSKIWTPQEIELARSLIDARSDKATFVHLLGRSRQACYDKLNRDKERSPSHMRAIVGLESKVSIPKEVIEDRNRRLMAARDLTAIICGDPAPQYSALYHRTRESASAPIGHQKAETVSA